MSDSKSSNGMFGWVWLIIAVCTAMIGHTIHHSFWWSVADFCFWPVAWCKWLICQEVNISIIKQTFDFFSK